MKHRKEIETVTELLGRFDASDPRERGEILYQLYIRGAAAEPAIPKVLEIARNEIPYRYPTMDLVPRHPFAAQLLGNLGKPAHDGIRALLASDGFLAVFTAVAALGFTEERLLDTIPRLIELAQVGTPSAPHVACIAGRSDGEIEYLRKYAITALGRMGEGALPAVPILLNLLSSPRPELEAVEALLGISRTDAILNRICEIVEDEEVQPYWRVKSALVLAREFLGDRARLLKALDRIGADPKISDALRSQARVVAGAYRGEK